MITHHGDSRFCEEKLIEIYDGKFHASIINDEIMLITSEDVKCVCEKPWYGKGNF